MNRLIGAVLLLLTPAFSQIQTIGGMNGLGHSTMTCLDRDGDGYGIGLSAVTVTVGSAASAGATSLSVMVSAGITSGMKIRVGTVSNMEPALVESVVGTTVNLTTPLLISHPAGINVTDQGCLGLDADDSDPLVFTAAQGITKYGSLAAFLTKIGNDQILDNPIPNGNAAAIGAGYSSPGHIWYLAPTSSGGLDSNPCNVGSPCLTFSRLVTEGYVPGDLVLLRKGWNGVVTPVSGSSSRYSVVMSYPGEQAIVAGANGQNVNLYQLSYIVIDGVQVAGGSQIQGGTPVGTGSNTTHDILIEHIFGNGPIGLSAVSLFNGLTNLTIQDSVLEGNDCRGGGCQHGIYNGSQDLISDHVTWRRDIAFGNDSNGFTFNGRCNSCRFTQLVSYSNGISGLTLEMGVSNSTVSSVLLASNANSGLTIFDYPGDCPTQGGVANICPYDQTGNLFENITIYQTGNANVANPNSSIGTCPVGINFCTQAGITVNNTTSPLTGNLGNNTFRNIIVTAYGYENQYPPIVYGDPSPIGTCDSTCLGWMSSSSFSNIIAQQTDRHNGGNVLGFGLGTGFGFAGFTCAGMATYTSVVNCSVADPEFANEGISLWNSETAWDFRLLSDSPALRAGTLAPSYDLAGRAFLGDVPSIGALERNPYPQGWTALPGATLLSAAPPNATGCPQPALGAACGSIQAGGGSYQYQTDIRATISERSGAIAVTTPGAEQFCTLADGGHSDSGDNSTYCLNMAVLAPSWSRPFGPSLVNYYNNGPTGNSDCEPYPTPCNTPNARHNTEDMVFLPWANKSLLFNGGVWPGGGHNGDTWLYDHFANTWAAGDPVACTTGSACATSPYTPTVGNQVDWTKSIAFLDTFVGICVADIPTQLAFCEHAGTVSSYNSATNTWTYVGGTYESTLLNGSTGDLDTSTRKIWIFGNTCDNSAACSSPTPGVYSITLAPVSSPTSAVTTTNMTTSVQGAAGSSCDALFNTVKSESPGIQYDTTQGQFVNYAQANSNVLTLFDPTTLICSNLSFPGGPPASTIVSGINGRWRKLPSRDIFVILTDASSDGTANSSTNVPAYVLSLNAPDPLPIRRRRAPRN